MESGRDVWKPRVRRLRESDLTVAELAAELGVNPKTLTYWKWRLGMEAREGRQRRSRQWDPPGMAGPGLLTDTIVRRWQDHLPLHRLEGIYACEGMELSRSTMCSWDEQLAPMAERLVAAMRDDAFTAPTPARMRRGCWCRRRKNAAAATSGCSWSPTATCSSSTRGTKPMMPSTGSWRATKAISLPMRTWSTITCKPAHAWPK
jgi:transposase-like protein